MKTYPSSKRERLIVAIKEGTFLHNASHLEFHDHAKETDPKKIEVYINDAEAGLGQIQQFSREKRRGTVEYTIGK